MIDDHAALRAQVRDSYETAEALEVYRKRVNNGLRMWESDFGETWDNVFVGVCR